MDDHKKPQEIEAKNSFLDQMEPEEPDNQLSNLSQKSDDSTPKSEDWEPPSHPNTPSGPPHFSNSEKKGLSEKIDLPKISTPRTSTGVGGYSTVRGVSDYPDLYQFPVREKKKRKYSNVTEYSLFRDDYGTDEINYVAVRGDLSQRMRVLSEVGVRVGDPEKMKGDNYLYFHAYRVSLVKDGKEIWRVYRR